MAINIESETILGLTAATKVLPRVNGRRPAISTLWRWCRKGLHGVRLEYVRVGRNIATSREALNRFFIALAAADEQPVQPTFAPPRPECATTSTARRLALESADRILEEAGI